MHVLRLGRQNRPEIEKFVLHAQQNRAERREPLSSAQETVASPTVAFNSSTVP